MNHARIVIGLGAWFLGVTVVVYHHVALHAAMAHEPTSNVITRMKDVFSFLPWIDWVYLAAMVIVGGILVVSGLLPQSRAKTK